MTDRKPEKPNRDALGLSMDVYNRIRPVLEEYFDDWLMIARQAGSQTKTILGASTQGWKDMKPILETMREWKKGKGNQDG